MVLERRMRVMNDSNAGEARGLRVAFATTNMETVNQHFGSAQQFALYSVDPENSTLLEVAEFGKLDQDGNEDKLEAKLDMLKGCAAVYCQAVGSSAVRQLMMRGIQPIKVVEGAVISDLIESLQDEMNQGPSAWLAKAISAQQGPSMSRFDEMEEEGWDE
jgi:nitrogen fixation protein NifX